MKSYLPLFSVQAEHTFFTGGWCKGLDFRPTPKTAAVFNKADLLMKNAPYGIRIYYNRNNTDAFKLYLSDPDEPLCPAFKVYARDPSFKNYANHRDPGGESVLYFDNEITKRDDNGGLRLHEAQYVSDDDFELLNSPRLAEIIDSGDRIVKPEFIVSIRLKEEEIMRSKDPSDIPFQKYCLTFKARETIWKYYLMGSLNQMDSYIVDLDNEMEFEDAGQESLPDNRMAVTFRSKQKLSLREKSEYRFQLKNKGPNGGKTLIRRLPVASAEFFFKEKTNGEEAIISEIFINS